MFRKIEIKRKKIVCSYNIEMQRKYFNNDMKVIIGLLKTAVIIFACLNDNMMCAVNVIPSIDV